MPKKEREKEVEVDVSSQPVKKPTFVTTWFNDYAVNNAHDLRIICDLTARSLYNQFRLFSPKGNNEIFGIIFYATFISILEFIRTKQKTYNNYTVQIMKSINIGYTNNSDTNNEKVGNFMPIMEFIGINANVVPEKDEDGELKPTTTAESCIRWMQANSKKNVDSYKEIQEIARQKLQTEYHTSLRVSEAILPVFGIFMDNITEVLKQKFREADGTDVSEVSMNVFGLFDAYYSFDEEEDREIIEFQPNIMMKLALKDDTAAEHG